MSLSLCTSMSRCTSPWIYGTVRRAGVGSVSGEMGRDENDENDAMD